MRRRYRPKIGDLVRFSTTHHDRILGRVTAKASAWGLWVVKPEDERHGSDRAGGVYLLRPSWMTREREAS